MDFNFKENKVKMISAGLATCGLMLIGVGVVYGPFLSFVFLISLGMLFSLYVWSDQVYKVFRGFFFKFRDFFIVIFLTVLLFTYGLILRFLRLGTDLNVYSLIPDDIINISSLVLGLWPFVSLWIRLIYWRFLDYKLYLHELFGTEMKNIFIYLLRYNLFFKVMKRIHRVVFVWISFILHLRDIYRYPAGKFKRFFRYLFVKPYLITLFIIVGCLFEVIIRNGFIFYSFYVLFVYMLLRPIMYVINDFWGGIWVIQVCEADYVSLNWRNPRYPAQFWYHFADCRCKYMYKPEITPELWSWVEKNKQPLALNNYLNNMRKHDISVRVLGNKNSSFCLRVKASYGSWAHVRWMHTYVSKIPAASVWHPLTAYFAKRATDHAALMNNHWSHYHSIQQMRKLVPYQEIAYIHFDNPCLRPISIQKVMDHNVLTNFYTVKKNGGVVTGFNKNIVLDTHNQKEDDVILDLRTARDPVIDRRVHGLDQKAYAGSSIDDASSKIFSGITGERYAGVIDQFKKSLFENNPELPQDLISKALEKLVFSKDDFVTHQQVWLEIVHLFPKNYIPPLLAPENFATIDFQPSTKFAYEDSIKRMDFVSRTLKERNVVCDYKQAIHVLEGSDLQRILGDSPY